MRDERIARAVEQIEPAIGARERMYWHILKRAVRLPARWVFRVAMPLLVLFCFVLVGLWCAGEGPRPANPATGALSVWDKNSTFGELGPAQTAPAGARDVRRTAWAKKGACVSFTYRGRAYIALVSKKQAGLLKFRQPGREISVSGGTARLLTIDCGGKTYYQLGWSRGDIYYFLYNSQGEKRGEADQKLALLDLASAMMRQNLG